MKQSKINNMPQQPTVKHSSKNIYLFASILLNLILIFALANYLLPSRQDIAPAQTTTNTSKIKKVTPTIQSTTKPVATPTPIQPNPTITTKIGNGEYTSKYGFSLKYPKTWFIDADAVENSDWVVDGGQTIVITSYDSNQYIGDSSPVPADKFKVDIVVELNNTKTLDELVNDTSGNTKKKQNIKYGNKDGVKLWLEGYDGSQILAYYYVEGNKAVRMFGYSTGYAYDTEFDNIAKSFVFIN